MNPQMQLSFANLVSTQQSRELPSICVNRDSSGFLEFFIFLLPLSTARGRLKVEKKKRIKSHLFQIISHESGIQAYIDILHSLIVSKCPEQPLQV
jgi:hypothetical protein